MKNNCILFATLYFSPFCFCLRHHMPLVQYPEIPDDVQAASDKLLNEAWQKSEMAWKKAWPVVQADAALGKP
ncbi:MAG: hypothetical protein MZV63_58110 [Marinilabiliales bacterium]|nr:hypothetical protein [Marinilabiliales bacterium]